MVAGALHAERAVVTSPGDHGGMTELARSDGHEDESRSGGQHRSHMMRMRVTGSDRAPAGEFEEELFGDPFERPRESSR